MRFAVAERLQQEFGLIFAEGYGLTETAALSQTNPPERAKLQCLGIPIFGVDSRVIDPVTLQPLPQGEVGEIVTHGPMVFKGYWGHEEATRAAFIHLVGKAFFRTGDRVASTRRDKFHHRPRAEARGRATEQDVIGWAFQHMAAYKVPRVVQFVEDFPKSGSGKVMWGQLQEREG